jgi:hypothetical protein
MPASTQTALARLGAFHSGSTSINGGGLMATETIAIHGFFGVSIKMVVSINGG